MTSEIIIMNKNGVSIAADSVATVNDSKIFNSANKIFNLSKFEPVGIIIYANANLMGIPWEILIKQYRDELADESFEKLSDYGKHFIKFLQNHDLLLNEEYQSFFVKTTLNNHFRVIFDFFRELIYKDNQSENNGKEGIVFPKAEEIPKLFKDFLTDFLENIEKEDDFVYGEEFSDKNFLDTFQDIVKSVRGQILIDFKEISSDLINNISLNLFKKKYLLERKENGKTE